MLNSIRRGANEITYMALKAFLYSFLKCKYFTVKYIIF